MEWTFVRARPRWTQRAREDVRRERKDLGFTEEGIVKVLDVPLALRILGSQQLWRQFTFEISLTVFLLVILLCYALGARYISFGYYIGGSIERDLNQVFGVPTVTFDINSPLNTSAPLGTYADGTPIADLSNLDPDTLRPINATFDLFYEQCLTGGIPTNESSEASGWCVRFNQAKRFSDIRHVEEFAIWVTYMLNHSLLFNQVGRDPAKSPMLLGAIRIRQLRSVLPHDLVNSQNKEQTTDITCSSGLSSEQALKYQTTDSQNSFPSPIDATQVLIGRSSPNLAQKLDFYYPQSGFSFDLPRCNPTQARDTWSTLLSECDWVSLNQSSAFFVSLSAYDSVSDTQIYAQYSFEIYPQGTRTSSKDVRVFRVPGGSSDRAVVWRILLCAASLIELVFFVARAIYRGTKANSVSAAINRWFVLDIVSLVIIQAAVWISIGNSLDSNVQAISSPEAMANLTGCAYTNHVTLFDGVSYDEKLEDLLLGISLILQGLKFFQLCQISPRLSAAYSIVNAVGNEILWWFVLTSCIFFFFAFGANFMFGLVLPQFHTLPSAFASAFLIFSKVPKTSMGDATVNAAAGLFESEFWKNFENPNLASLMWELAEYMRLYELDPLFGFAFWLGLLVVLVYWIMRNLLLGVVLSGYETVRRNIEAEELDREERALMKRLKEARRKRKTHEVSRLKTFADRIRQIAWRMWNNSKVDELLVILRTDPAIRRRGFATTQEMEKIFKDLGIVRDGKTLSILDASKDPGEWFKDGFFANFEFNLIAVDEAILILSQQERPFALSLESVAAIRQAKTQREAIDVLLQRCEVELSSYPELPFVKELLESRRGNQRLQDRMFEIAKRAAEKCPEVSGDEESYFDIQALVQRLATRLSEEVETAVARCMDRAGYGEASRIDVAVDYVLTSCVEELGLYLDAIPDRGNIRVFIARGLKQAKRAIDREGTQGASRITEPVVVELAEIFPCCVMGWQAQPTAREIQLCREMFEARLAAILADKDAGGGSDGEDGVVKSSGGNGGSSDGEDEDDDGETYSISSSVVVDPVTGMKRNSSLMQVDESTKAAANPLPSNIDMEDTFDPTAQQKWEAALFSGEFFLSLAVIHSLRATRLADQLTREMMQLERNQVNLEKELLSARRLLDEKISARRPLATSIRDVKKHGIEPHPNDKTFHVHYINPVTKEYKFVGVFFTQEDAEAAMTKTITQESTAPEDSDDEGQTGSDTHGKTYRDQDSWEEDDRNYGLLAKELKVQKKQERKKRHQGSLLDNPFAAESEDSNQTKKRAGKRHANLDNDEGEISSDEGDEVDADAKADTSEEDEVVVGEKKRGTSAKKVADTMMTAYSAVTLHLSKAFSACQSWMNQNSENRIHFDTVDNVWRDANDNIVKVITKPKTIAPLAGKRWAKLQQDEN